MSFMDSHVTYMFKMAEDPKETKEYVIWHEVGTWNVTLAK